MAGEAFQKGPSKRPVDPYDDPGYRAWARAVIDELVPKMKSCNVMVSVLNTPPDDQDTEIVSPKFCVELGVSIMLGKPLIVGVFPGWKVPEKLAMIADRIIETDRDSMGDFAAKLGSTLKELDAEEDAEPPRAGELRIVAAPWVPEGAVYVCSNPDGSTPTFTDVVARLVCEDW